MSSSSKRILSATLAVVILLAAIAAAVVLVKTRKKPKRASAGSETVTVSVLPVQVHDESVSVVAQGTVIPARQVRIAPQVSGRVVWKHPELVPGGRFKKGQPLLRIDPRDYAAALAQQQAQIESRTLAVEQEKSRRVIAEREWTLFEDAGVPDGGLDGGQALALRKPQLRAANASLKAARSMAQKARLDLSRTQITAPFNCIVDNENVDIGQLVTPAAQLGQLVGTDAFWVRISIPIDQLSRVHVPAKPSDKDGSAVRVWQETGDGVIERHGRVIRLYGSLDPMGRMARVLVEVPHPFDPPATASEAGVKTPESKGKKLSRLPMLLGAYVHASIKAGVMKGVVKVPRTAIKEGNLLYVAGSDNKLHIREANIVWRLRDSVLLRDSVKPGERIIVSHVTAALEGMSVRVVKDSNKAPAAASSQEKRP